jgi:tetratricopeptide (TPR) repeat protein
MFKDMNNISGDITQNNPTLCLNMIVKNESKVIRRLLESVSNLIDSYCICDTGSTDDTIEIIHRFFEEKGIPGKIVREPFRDFGYNRTFALQSCENTPLSDYILLLDADMVLWTNPDTTPQEFKQSLTKDVYTIFQGNDDFYYKNTRIVKNNRGCTYWGVTHEYVKTPHNSTQGLLEKSQVFIVDIGDGGSKADKFERDIRLLKQGLIDHPDNDRYTFYLANSYYNSDNYEKAIENYEKRIKLGKWHEEVWYSYYRIGMCYARMNQHEFAINAWLNAYEVFPNRIENLYEIVKHYRTIGKHKLAHVFYELADNMRKTHGPPDYLFLQKDIYDYKLDYEFSIMAYYVNPCDINIPKLCMKICTHPSLDKSTMTNIIHNYKFYAPSLIDSNSETNNTLFLENIAKTNAPPGFSSTTPSLCKSNEDTDLYVNVRYVNYTIDENGNYINKDTIQTINCLSIIDTHRDEWSVKTTHEIRYNTELDDVYVGLEDIRLLPCNNTLLYNANRGLDYREIKVEHGEIDPNTGETVNSRILTKEGEQSVEKNWVLFEAAHQLFCIYEWYPLTIGTIKDKTYNTKCKNPMPPFFKHVRGSTNGTPFVNDLGETEIWFLCHTVSYENRRYYYHIFVCLDADTMTLKKYTPWFTFEKNPVEYSLGFAFLPSAEILIGYSTMDSTTKYRTIKKSKVDDMMIIMSQS